MMNTDASVSAMRAAGVRLAVTANNIANINTEGFKASRTVSSVQPNGTGVMVNVSKTDSAPDLSVETVDSLITLRYAQANGKVFKVQSSLDESIFSMFA